MAPRSDNSPVVAIVGETGSGKTALAIELARQFGGEIIAADSRTVYRELTIAAAKPTLVERAVVPHHLLDIANANEQLTVTDFKRLATEAIASIGQTGGVSYLVGGTGLYIDAVLYDFQFRPKGDAVERAHLNQLTISELQDILHERGIALPENERNPRHLIRTIETNGVAGKRSMIRPNTIIIGIQVDKEMLREKITARVDAMLMAGLLDEIRTVSERYGWDVPALQAPAYKAFRDYFAGNMSLDEAKLLFIQHDMRLAKRQRTWFKRNSDIHWICNKEEAVDLVTTLLNK